jgi:subtilisin family serine protease
MKWHGWISLALITLAGSAGRAQIVLPPLPGAQLPSPGAVIRDVAGAADQIVRSSVRSRADALLGRYRGAVERGPGGAPVMRAVIVALTPGPQALQSALALGYEIQTDSDLAPLGGRVVTLLVPRGRSTRSALRQLRRLDPAGSYDFDHLFAETAAAGTGAVMTAPGRAAATHLAMPGAPRIGLVDGGVDAAHPVFAQARPLLLGCAGQIIPSAHGTAVASLLTGAAAPAFNGAAPAAPLVAVDVYCGDDQPGGRTRDIVLALAQLAAEQVSVINISMVGPDNTVLRSVVQRVQQQGILIVAAAGNDGPSAPPLYPAAYPGVIAVTAVDARNNVLLEACGGKHVQFAAPGADMMAARSGGGFTSVRGTSYAAPLVAGLIQHLLAAEDSPGLQQVVQQLAAAAEDRGRKGRDARYGYGVIARDLRTPPSGLAGKPLGD